MPEPAAPDATVPLVVGIGNEHRRDDGCGLAVARALRSRLGFRAEVVELSGDPTALLDLWADRDLAVAVDATRSTGPPGGIVRAGPSEIATLPPAATDSTHGLSLVEIARLGESLGRMPRHLVVYGIEADDLSTGIGFTAAVAAAVPVVVQRIEREIAEWERTTGGRGNSDA